jgi:site-specific DNA-methyltransferase (adenine-specific)
METMTNRIIHGDCVKAIQCIHYVDCIFADPPDNVGLKYQGYVDKLPPDVYIEWLEDCLRAFIVKAPIVWLSYNAKWNFHLGHVVQDILQDRPDWEAKLCVQTFTFGQNNKRDLGNGFRPLLRLKHKDAPLFPDQVKVPSWRQLHGDKRAAPGGRVPLDVFDFPRVTGNSKQRRKWHKTQLHEGLVERCIKLSTAPHEMVVDPFAGTGTTLRVCKRIKRRCILIEVSEEYCDEIAKEHGMEVMRLDDGASTKCCECCDELDDELIGCNICGRLVCPCCVAALPDDDPRGEICEDCF